LLALGDAHYVNFCGFGREVEAWLKRQGAQAMFDRIDVDNSDAAALQRWRDELGRLGAAVNPDEWKETVFETWRLGRRVLLNAGSAGNPIHHIELLPPHGTNPQWEAGDLVEIVVPADPDRPREYSLASLPSDGSMHLLVRKEIHPDGSAGAASGWLTEGADVGSDISLRLRPNRNFHLGANAERPLILIGNGTGLAGLRGHLKAREISGRRRNWLIFGERNAAHDLLYRDELDAWRTSGLIERMDRVFSRDQPERLYVQDRLKAEEARLREWVDSGAAIYVCGSLEGMATGVDQVLAQVLGRDGVDGLIAEGRYRRDVY
jgi:sulfite reductase (NADPH) flavoprotein alpha-component